MPKVVKIIRQAPVDCRCSGCGAPTRNVAHIYTGVQRQGRRYIESFRCDACLAALTGGNPHVRLSNPFAEALR